MSMLNVRINHKYDSYANWMSSSLILNKGELAVVEIPSQATETGLTPPAIGIKIGDGVHTFANLAWIQATAGDVYAWAKAATKPEYSANEITGLTEFVQDISDIDTNTQYKFTIADNYKIKIQKKDIGDADFVDYETVDLTSVFNAKADKVNNAVADNFASLDSEGNLKDSGKKAADFATAAQGALADTAVQGVAEGATNGTISVDGTEVAVHGLGSAAFTESSAYATADHNHDAKYAAKQATEEHIANADIHVTTEDKAKWNAAEENAKKYADENKVASITAGDASVTIGGTATAPNVAAKLSQAVGNALELAEDGLKVILPTAAEYSVVKDENSGEFAAIYHLTKDGVNVGAAINIPKDMVVQSGSVVTNPEGQPAGTYIELLLQNVNDPLYINVGDLIEYVTGATATDGIITTAVSDDHVLTATINNGTVTLAKLDADTQAKINKAHEHANKEVIDGISAEKVTAWDNAVQTVSGVTTTKTGTDVKVTAVPVTLLQNVDGDTLVFNCGTASTVI